MSEFMKRKMADSARNSVAVASSKSTQHQSYEQFSFSKHSFRPRGMSQGNMVAAVTLIQVYRMKYGANYDAMLNWDEQNALLRALGHNQYPDVRSIGRPIRWEFQLDYTDADEEIKEPCCGKKNTSQISRADLNFKTIAQLERYNRILYMDLEREKKAIQNQGQDNSSVQ